MTRRSRVVALLALAAAAGAGAWALARRDMDPPATSRREDPPPTPEDASDLPGLASSSPGSRAPEPPVPTASPRAADGTAPVGPRRLRVEVVDADTGAEIPKAVAGLQIGGRSRTQRAMEPFELPVELEDVIFAWAHAAGYQRGEWVEVHREDAGPVRIALRRGLPLRGVVVFEEGTPYPSPAVWIDEPTAKHEHATSAADGAFGWDAVAPGIHRVVVGQSRPFSGRARLASRETVAGTTGLRIVVPEAALREAGLVLVNVVSDATGEPVSGAALRLRTQRASIGVKVDSHLGVLPLPSDAPAWLAVGLAEDGRGGPLPLGPVLLEVPRDANRLEVRLPPERTIEGRVVDEHGVGVAGVRVSAALAGRETRSAEALDDVLRPDGIRCPESGPDGSFRLGQLGDHDLHVVAHVGGSWQADRVGPVRGGARDVVLRLRRLPRRSAVLTILDSTGAPVPGAWAQARRPSGEITSDAADAEGRARLEAVDPTVRYELRATSTDPRFLPSVLEEWNGADTTVRLRFALTIEGVVADERGRPPRAVEVEARDAAGESFRARVEASGRFRVERLEPGEYRLRAHVFDGPLGFEAEPREGQVAPAGAANVRLSVRVGSTLDVRVLSAASGRTGDELRILPESGRSPERVLRLGTDGSARAHRLSEETTYTVWAPPTADGYALARGVRAPGAVELVRTKGAGIRVRVSGEALDGAVAVKAAQGPLQVEGNATTDGAFEIAHLPPGTWTVTAHAPSPKEGVLRTATADAQPGTTIDLVIPPAAK